jgi:type II secretory pathway pseudopilin PulG
MKRRSRIRQAGMSLIEVVISMGVIVVSVGGLGLMVLSTQAASQDMADRDIVRAQAIKYMERLIRLPYGTQFDPIATGGQVQELFDDNTVVTGGSPISLMSLRSPINSAGWRFFVEGFEVDGTFEIEINSDLDGNGVFQGVRGSETPSLPGLVAGDGSSVVDLESEGDNNLLRVEIFWNGESLLKTYRAAPVEGT